MEYMSVNNSRNGSNYLKIRFNKKYDEEQINQEIFISR